MAVFISKVMTDLGYINNKGFWEHFRSLQTNLEKYRFVNNLPEAHKHTIFWKENLKSKRKSLEFKELGNAAYKKGKIKEAIKLYSRSIAYSPDDECRSIGYANRSAGLFHLQEYAAATRDIDRALVCGYQQPDNTHLSHVSTKQHCWAATLGRRE